MQSTGGKLDESYVLVIAREVAKGLQAIHNSGIIHRDLKGEACHQKLFFIKAVLERYSLTLSLSHTHTYIYLYIWDQSLTDFLLVQLPILWCMKKAEFKSSTLAFLV